MEATDEVTAGADLVATGNRQYGKNIYIATGRPFDPSGLDLTTGRSLLEDTIKTIGDCELRCERRGARWPVAVYDGSDRRISRELTCRAGETPTCDEGRLAWFSPVETYCTPWSDNDPDVCQVVTVERLRKFAAHPPGEKKAPKKARRR